MEISDTLGEKVTERNCVFTFTLLWSAHGLSLNFIPWTREK